MRKVAIYSLFSLLAGGVFAQGNLETEEVDVIRDYNPILADAVKVSVTGNIPEGNDSVEELTYEVPLTFYDMPYQPIRIKPVALKKVPQEDITRNYLKAGFGTQFTPLAEVYLNSGRSDEFQYGLAARYISSNGSRENQDYSDLDVAARTKIFFDKKYVMPINAWFRNDIVHYYGYNEPLTFPADSVRQRYNRYGFDFAFSNLTDNDWDLDYSLGAGFRGTHSLSGFRQLNPFMELGGLKELDNGHQLGGGLLIDYYNYNGPIPFENTFTSVYLGYVIEQSGWSLNAKVDNTIANQGKYYIIPDVEFSKDLIGDNLVFIAGVDGQLQKNNFSGLSDENPFLSDSIMIRPSTAYELFGGIRASTTGNWSFSVKGYYTDFDDKVFYINNPSDTLRFSVLYGNGTMAGGVVETGYFVTDKLRFEGMLNVFTFNELDGVEEAWHTPTLNWRLSGEYRISDKISAEADVFGFNSMPALLPSGVPTTIDGLVDINLSAVYNYSNRFNIFLDLNNLAGFRYQRFYNYPTYGFNLLGGLSFSF